MTTEFVYGGSAGVGNVALGYGHSHGWQQEKEKKKPRIEL